MADALARRFRDLQVQRHRENAERAVAALRGVLDQLDLDRPALATGAVRNAANDLAELNQAVAALKAIEDVERLSGTD